MASLAAWLGIALFAWFLVVGVLLALHHIEQMGIRHRSDTTSQITRHKHTTMEE